MTKFINYKNDVIKIVNRRISLSSFLSCSNNNGKDDCKKYDITIVGGGIVGLAVAREIKMRKPQLNMCVLEKEKLLSMHQTGHNSGVIHAGIYYTPGSLKAKLCVGSLIKTYKYCDQKGIKYDKCGKLIVATNDTEVKQLNEIFQKGLANKVPDLKLLDPKEISEIEPNCVGMKAIYSPHTGIINWRDVAKSYGEDFVWLGGTIFTDSEVTDFKEATEWPEYPVKILTKNKMDIQSKYVITCGGLHADKLAVMSGGEAYPKIVPFRGTYLKLKKDRRDLVKGNIYPVPDMRFPFLGVHFTPRINGEVWVGPNAILAFEREGYKVTDIKLIDLFDVSINPGFYKLCFKYVFAGIDEVIKGVLMSKQVEALQKFVPSLSVDDVEPGPSGVRAQALNKDGKMVDDFVFDSGTGQIGWRLMHVRNAPSPAATSSLGIAEMIADNVEEKFEL